MKLRDANLQVNEKNSFTHPPPCVLPSFSYTSARLLFHDYNFFQKIQVGSSNLLAH